MENQQVKYQIGEVSLKNIGKEIGNITPTMVNRLFNSAHEKVKSLTFFKPIKLLSQEEDELLEDTISSYREEAAKEYIKIFREVNFDIYDFIMQLKKLQYITDSELKLINSEEIESMLNLKLLFLDSQLNVEESDTEVKKLLKEDLENKNNVFKLYQSMVSRVAFPEKKRGRPKKEYSE
jgi:hypothetical protein